MTRLAELIHPLPDLRRTPLSSLQWWESRRWFYNKVVGCAGLFTLGTVSLFFSLPPGAEGPPPLAMLLTIVPLYGLLANACYFLGWAVEMLARAVWGRSAPDVGPLLFREGLIFSVGLTLFPAGLAALAWLARVVSVLIG